MLHIFNGDSTETTFAQTKLPGETFSWKEALIIGPNPSGKTLDEWMQLRSKHLSKVYGIDEDECKELLRAQTNALDEATRHDEVVLWFEYDLFCQLHLVYILSYFTQQQKLPAKLSLICINEYHGVEPFYGLGQLYPENLSELNDKRQPINQETLILANEAWQAYTAPNPEEIERLLQKDTSALPFLKDAFTAHLKRFPSGNNGLGYLQHTILDFIASGIDEFKPLFHLLQELNPEYGLGDLQLWHIIYEMNNMGNPLIEIFNLDTSQHPAVSKSFNDAYFRLTATGKAVLVGNRDMLNINHIDYWLGGVHINYDNPIWRWDEEKNKLYRDD